MPDLIAALSLLMWCQPADDPQAAITGAPAWVVERLVGTGQDAPLAGRTFDHFATAPLARDGVVAFGATLDDGSQVIVTSGASGMRVRAASEQSGPTGLMRLGEPSGLAAGDVWFAAADREGVVVACRTLDDGLASVLRSGANLPGLETPVLEVGYPVPAGDTTVMRIATPQESQWLVALGSDRTRVLVRVEDGLEGWPHVPEVIGPSLADGECVTFNVYGGAGSIAVCRADATAGAVDWIGRDTLEAWLDAPVTLLGNPVPLDSAVHFTLTTEAGDTFIVTWLDDAHATLRLTPADGFTAVLGEPALSTDLIAFIGWAPGGHHALRVVDDDRHATVLERGQDLDGRRVRRIKLGSQGVDGDRVFVGIDFTDDTSGLYVVRPAGRG